MSPGCGIVVADAAGAFRGKVAGMAACAQAPGAPTVVGRDRERAVIDELAANPAPASDGLVVEAADGLGKTTLWRYAVARAAAEGLGVLSLQAAEPEAEVAFSGLGALVDITLAHRPFLCDRLDPVADALEGRDGSEAFAAVAGAFHTFLRQCVEARPVLVAIDDLHWLDRASADALVFAMRRLGPGRVRLLATLRPGADALAGLAPLEAAGRLRVHRLGALEPAAFADVVAQRSRDGLTRGVARHLYAATAGNPALGGRIAEHLPGPVSWRVDRFPLPADLLAPIAAQLDGLPRATLEALVAAAAMTDPSPGLLAAVLGAPAAEDGRLRPAVEHGIVRVAGRLRFTDPLVASALYARPGPADRQALHRRIAEAVGDPLEAARHRVLAAKPCDARAAAHAATAAERARDRGLRDLAAELGEAALRLAPDGLPQAVGWLRAAAADRCTAGDPRHARVLLERAAAAPGPGRAEALADLALLRAQTDGLPPARALLSLALGAADDDATSRCYVELRLALVAREAGETAVAGQHAAAAQALSLRPGVPAPTADAVLAGALSMRAWTAFAEGRGDPAGLLARARALGDQPTLPVTLRPEMVEAMIDLRVGRLDGARVALQRLDRAVVLAGDEAGPVPVRCALAEVECAAGDWELAGAYADSALSGSLEVGLDGLSPWAELARARVDALRGDLEIARGRATRAVEAAERGGWVTAAVANRALLGFVELSAGDPSAAAGHLAGLADPAAVAGEPAMAAWVPDHVEALVLAGDPEAAERVLAPFAERCAERGRAALGLPIARCRALLRAASGDRSGAAAELAGAVAGDGGDCGPFERARAGLLLGSILRQDRQPLAARRPLSDALAGLERLGAHAWAERARAELDAASGGRTGADGFTPVERRIIALAVTGSTTREIAAQLLVSTRTVESHLSAIYRKSGVRSRGQLVHRLTASSS